MKKEIKNNFEIGYDEYTKAIKYDFMSIDDLYKYISTRKENSEFAGRKLQSFDGREDFTGTKSYEEAISLMKHGSKDISVKLNGVLNKKEIKQSTNELIKRNVYDVVGFQPSVPRYLQGVPNSMINQKNYMKKVKVVTITKNISYPAFVEQEKIIDESAKILSVVRYLESKGVRVNVNLFFGVYGIYQTKKECMVAKIRVKNANERLNISKLSFVMCHPSMLRRIMFRLLEVCEDAPRGCNRLYGKPFVLSNQMLRFAKENEICFPSLVGEIPELLEQFNNLL